ncbi:MAG: PQQ-binding-like beta-propeller repeat protein [Candidatus Moraniibacteriota bacterium]
MLQVKNQEKMQKLLEIIRSKGIATKSNQEIISPNGDYASWLIDLRNVFLRPDALSLIVDIFWEEMEKYYPFQVGGQEVAAIPLVAAIVLKSQMMGKPVSGFVMRKSRKKYGLQKIIEGEVTAEKIILVDDLINSGGTAFRQIKILEEINKQPEIFFSIVNFRKEQSKEFLKKQGVELVSLFNLDDMHISLGEDVKSCLQAKDYYKIIWRFQSPNPTNYYSVPKSTPCIDEDKIYFGSDSGIFWALNQSNGLVVWKFEIGYNPGRKGIFSSPVIYGDLVYFGAYDGNVYALNRETGKFKWKYMDADFVGSSPAIAPELNLLFIGLEFSLTGKHGGVVALDLKTGKKIWEHTMREFVHCSPAYFSPKKLLAIGGNDSFVYLFEAETGKLKWKYQTGGPIKSSLVFDEKRNLLIFGSFDKNLYALDLDTGEVKGKFATREAIYSTPKIISDDVVVASLDKHLYSVNLETGKMNWKFVTGGRIFSSPEIIEGKIFICSNDGKMYEINSESGKAESFFQASERITNRVVYDAKNKRFFVSTGANEIYCLKKT